MCVDILSATPGPQRPSETHKTTEPKHFVSVRYNKSPRKTLMKSAKYDISYMRMAHVWAENSHCKRKQVGALIVKDNMIISDGFNGTPSGMDNCCEDAEGETKWEVIHAEANAILKLTNTPNSCEGATLYITLSPCRDCSKLILRSKISRVVYGKEHSDVAGIDFLRNNGVLVDQLELHIENTYTIKKTNIHI